MSNETPIAGGDLAGLVTDNTLTRDDVESALTKLGYAVKRKFYVSVVLYTYKGKSQIKIYPLNKQQAEFLNQKDGTQTFVSATDWKSAYDENPVN